MDEFDLIARYFRPLSEGFPGAFSLTDDAGLVEVPPGHQLIVTTDMLSAGVHFIGDEDAALIARKLLRVNLSDLAGKGAEPLCYFLGLALPKNTSEAWIARFTEGLAADQAEFSVLLAGGDTTATDGPLTLSVTALGTVPNGQMLRRNGAQAGDGIYVTGTLGDAALGLRCVKGELTSRAFLEERYRLPRPRLAQGRALRALATACMDISDGLVQDLGHLARASGVRARIEAAHLPTSNAATTFLERDDFQHTLLTGGDDYELLFTLPPHAKPPQGCTRIGVMEPGEGVVVVDAEGQDVTPARGGWKHFT